MRLLSLSSLSHSPSLIPRRRRRRRPHVPRPQTGHDAEEDEGQDEEAQHGAYDAGVAGGDSAGAPAASGRAGLRPRPRLAHQSQQHHLLDCERVPRDSDSASRMFKSVLCVFICYFTHLTC